MTSVMICGCGCHTNPDEHHMMPCCQPCNICEKNIVEVYYPAHRKECLDIVANKIWVCHSAAHAHGNPCPICRKCPRCGNNVPLTFFNHEPYCKELHELQNPTPPA